MWPCCKKCGLLVGSVSLEVGFGISNIQARLNVFFVLLIFLLPIDLDIELLAPSPAPCLTVYHHAETINKPQLSALSWCFFTAIEQWLGQKLVPGTGVLL